MASDGSNEGEKLEIDLNVPADRRKFLSVLSAAGAAGLAGCSGGGNGGDTETATATQTGTQTQTATQTSGGGGTTQDGTTQGTTEGTTQDTTQQTTTSSGLPMTDRTLKSFVSSTTADSGKPKALNDWGWNPANYRSQFPRGVYPLLFGRTVSTANGQNVPMYIEEYSATESEFRYKLRDDATWSDGTPMTAEDRAKGAWLGHQLNHKPPSERKKSEISSLSQAVTSIEAVSEKEWVVRSDFGGFADFWYQPVARDRIAHAGSAEMVTQAGWDEWARTNLEDQFDSLWDNKEARTWLSKKTQAPITDVEYFPNDPKQLPYSGAFTLKEVRENTVVLEKNPEFYNSQGINWPEVTLQRQNNAQAQRALLKNNEVDFATLFSAPETVIESFPDNIQQYPWGVGDSSNIIAQGQHPHFGKPAVRKAMLQALDKQQLVNVGNKYTTQKLPEPAGLHPLDEDQFISQETQNQFTSFDYDTDAAAQRMKDAGYTMKNGTWMTPEGDRLTAELMTASSSISLEATIVSQLNSFGIDTDLSKVTDTQMSNRLDNGDYTLATETWGSGYSIWGPALLGIYFRAFQQSVRRKKWGIWSEEKAMAFVDRHDEVVNKEYNWTNNIEGIWPNPELCNPAKQDEWVPHIKAPPVGQPDAPPEVTYPVVYWGLIWNQDLSQEKRKEIIRGTAWVANWTLHPHLPMMANNSLAFQDTEQWNVPDKGSKWWKQYMPVHKLLEQDRYHAAPQQ